MRGLDKNSNIIGPTVRGWVLALAVAGGLAATIVTSTAQTEFFRDQMNNGAGWGVNGSADNDWQQTFNYDYSADGIPEAPHTRVGDDATRGVKMEANLVAPAAVDVFTLYPMGESFSGSYQLRFDAWMNYGTSATTEFLGGGIGYNGTSFDVNSGAQFITTGDGGSAADWRSLTNGGYMSTASWYPAGSLNNTAPYYTTFLPSVNGSFAGAPGFQWITWEFNVSGNTVKIFIEKPNGDRLLLISYDIQPGVAPTTDGNISLVYADFFTSVSATPAQTFGLIDNVVVSNATPFVSVATTSATGSETGPTPAVFTLTRTDGSSPVTVNIALSGTAQNGVDYTNALGAAIPSTVTFAAGDTTTNISIIPVDDAEREAIETVVLTLAAGTGYRVDTPSTASATILDSDVTLLYWDSDGATAGAGGAGMPAGTWGVDNFWSTSAAGDVATGGWTDWNAAVFSAGTDAAGMFSVTNNSAQKADYLSFEEGIVTLEGSGSLTLTNFEGIKVADRALITSVLDGAAGLTSDGPGNLVLGGANTYTGPTKVNAGSLVVGAAGGVIPDGSAVTLGATATLNLNDQLFSGGSFDETIGSLNGAPGSQAVVPGGFTLTFGGDNTDMLWDGTTSGGGLFAKVGTGILDFGTSGVIADALAVSNGVLKVDSSLDLGAAAVTTDLYLDGGTLRRGAGVEFLIPPLRNIIIGAAGGTMELTEPAGGNVFLYGSTTENAAGTIQGGVLTCQGPGEFRTYFNHNTFSQLIVKDGFWFTIGQSTYLGFDDSFGAVPSVETADAIKLVNGGQIRKAGGQNLFLDPRRGITLDGGGTIRAYGGDNNCGTFGISSRISGTGPLTLNATVDAVFGPPILLLLTNNTHSGGTVVAAASVYALNTVGSATGSGSVTVNSGATLGGNGTIGGPVTVNAGTLAAGYSYYTGATPSPTEVAMPVAKIVLTNGLDLSAGGTNVWQLGALSEANPGTDWDQVELTGGTLTLGGSSTLAVEFTGSATAPDLSTFWQANHQWQVIKYIGGTISGNFSAITGVAGAIGGTFSTTVDANGVNLVWTSTYVTPTPVTSMSASVGGGNVTINYAGAAGNQFVLLKSLDVDAALATWARVATNAVGTGSFVIPVGLDDKAFYSIQSE